MEVSRHFLSEIQPESLGITQAKPKYPHYATVSKRNESFSSWPDNLPLKPSELVEAGFVYTGVEDSVRCYYCGGGLRNWERGDDPWIEHITWYPSCPHVLLVKGQNHVDSVCNSGKSEADGPLVEVVPQTTGSHLESVAAQSCLQMGYPEGCVLKAIQKFILDNGHTNYRGVDLCEILLNEEDEMTDVAAAESDPKTNNDVLDDMDVCDHGNLNDIEEHENKDLYEEEEEEDHVSVEELYEENCRLKDSQLCKICLDRNVSIIFLPCGHMVTCAQCAPAFTVCPLCRLPVSGFVKAYFATTTT